MQKVKRIFLISLSIILIIGVLVFLFLYYGSYSTGYRSGIIMKVSQKGYLFKTNEGTLNVEGIDTYNKGGSLSSVWYFSVDKDQKELLAELEKASLKRQRIQLQYEEKLVKFFWRGETRYFVTKIIVDSNTPPPAKDENKTEDKTKHKSTEL